MSGGCTGRGVAQAKEYYPLNSQAEIKATLEQNIPVMAGFTLTPNFYTTKGIVTSPKVIWQVQLIPMLVAMHLSLLAT